jgi:hypothetical protein
VLDVVDSVGEVVELVGDSVEFGAFAVGLAADGGARAARR